MIWADHAGVGHYTGQLAAVQIRLKPSHHEVRRSNRRVAARGGRRNQGWVASHWRYVGIRGYVGVEEYSRGCGGIIRPHRVIGAGHLQRIEKRGSASNPA